MPPTLRAAAADAPAASPPPGTTTESYAVDVWWDGFPRPARIGNFSLRAHADGFADSASNMAHAAHVRVVLVTTTERPVHDWHRPPPADRTR